MITVTISLRKSERLVSKPEDFKNFWKEFTLLVKNRSMYDGFEELLKQVVCLIILADGKFCRKMTYWFQ